MEESMIDGREVGLSQVCPSLRSSKTTLDNVLNCHKYDAWSSASCRRQTPEFDLSGGSCCLRCGQENRPYILVSYLCWAEACNSWTAAARSSSAIPSISPTVEPPVISVASPAYRSASSRLNRSPAAEYAAVQVQSPGAHRGQQTVYGIWHPPMTTTCIQSIR